MNGVLIIDKPEGFTSHDVVAKLRGILKTKKVGHTGTLDPFATGVLVILVGKATRLARFLDKDEKEYEAVIRFGFETETGDRTGDKRGDEYSIDKLDAGGIKEVLSEFRGEIVQMPPMYSAKKVKGKKLYELARKGIEVERKPLKVTVSELELVGNFDDSKETDYKLRIVCSAGTYIRTLAEDIGRRIGIGCHLAELRRTRAGRFDLSKSISLEQLEEKVVANGLGEILISMNEAVTHLPERKLDSDEEKRVGNGMKIGARIEDCSVQNVRLTDAENHLVAIGSYDESTKEIQPRIVFRN